MNENPTYVSRANQLTKQYAKQAFIQYVHTQQSNIHQNWKQLYSTSSALEHVSRETRRDGVTYIWAVLYKLYSKNKLYIHVYILIK